VFIVVSLYFVMDSVRKLLDTPPYPVDALHHYDVWMKHGSLPACLPAMNGKKDGGM